MEIKFYIWYFLYLSLRHYRISLDETNRYVVIMQNKS